MQQARSVFTSSQFNPINQLKYIVAVIALTSVDVGYASGFQIWEQDAAGIGDAHAGYALPNSASAAFYNPANLTDLQDPQLTTGATVIQLHVPFKGTIATSTLDDSGPIPSDTEGGGNPNVVPNFYLSTPLGSKAAAAIGLVTPFGLSTDYGALTNVKYAATDTSLRTIDITPALAYRFNDRFSLGAGMDIEYLWGNFDQYSGFGGGDTKVDIDSVNKANSWGVGYHFGFVVNVTDATQFGFAYHSKVQQNMKGSSTATTSPVTGSPSTSVGNDLSAALYLPATSSVTLTHDLNAQWQILGTLNYTQWSSFKELVLKNVVVPGGDKTSVAVHENFRNTWYAALGAHYQENQQIMWKFGLAFDETPTNNADRNLQLPGQDKIAVAIGIRAQICQRVYIDAGYTHLFQFRAQLNRTQTVATEDVTTVGHVDGSADVAGLQLTVNL